MAINCTVTAFCEALETLELKQNDDRWPIHALHQRYLDWHRCVESDSPVQLSKIMHWLSNRLPEDAIITNGAGNYAGWIHRFFSFKQFHTQIAPTSGSMGYGLPAALSAKAQNRDKTVICFAGDGCLQMTIQELATATQFNLNIIVIVVNNGSWGTIRMHQERQYPGRVKGTDLINPDFIAVANAYGFHSESVTRTDEFEAAFVRAENAGKPALIEIKHPVEYITATQTLSEMSRKAKSE